MILHGEAAKLTIIIGELERVYKRPLFEALIFAAKKYKLAGATVCKGFLSYGADSMHHSVKVFSLSNQLPVVITLVDVKERIEDFGNIASKLLNKACSGGIIFIEPVNVVRYSMPQTESAK